MRVSVCLVAILIPECLGFHSGYSAPRSRIAGIYSGVYSYSGISQTNAPLELYCKLNLPALAGECQSERQLVLLQELTKIYNFYIFLKKTNRSLL